MKKHAYFLLPAVFALFVSACNSGGGDPTTQPSPQPTTQVDPTSEPTTVPTSSPTSTPTSTSSSSTPVKDSYLITFKDENGDILDSKKWEEGTIPSYNYVKEDTAEWDYTVEGWSLTQGGKVITIPAVSAEATYWAIVSKAKQKYDISFYNEKNGLIKTDNLEYGTQPSCDYKGPQDTAQYDYDFKGWTNAKGELLPSIPSVTGAASYYAKVTSTTKSYQIRFFDEEGVQLSSTNIEYGVQPTSSYKGKDSDKEWKRTFKGWATSLGGTPLASIPTVTKAADYYAVVDKVKNQYTITFNSNGGSAVASITKDYGTSVNAPTDPKKDGHSFVAWTSDKEGKNKVTWPYTIVDDIEFYAQWNEGVDIKAYFKTLISSLSQDPYSFIPDELRPENSANHVEPGDVNYNFESFTNVNSIKYGGHGEQWHMVLENIKESERFYAVTTVGESLISASVVAFNNYLDKNPGTTASHSLDEAEYKAMINYKNGDLTYSIKFKTSITLPLFGEINPQIDMSFNVASNQKHVRIQLTDKNAMKYVVEHNAYTFAIEYGVSSVSRKAYFELYDDEDTNEIEGHIYEFVQYKDKDLVPACADFYIGETYTSVVGNKANAIPGFAGYINELYETNSGKLLGYKVRETFTKWGIEKTYNTLWFNLNDIKNINSVKAVSNGSVDPHENNHDIYLNGSDTPFEPVRNKVAVVPTSRRYDVEIRKQFFYGYVDDKLVEYETNIPMMFIQDNGDKAGETNYSTFEEDILSKNKIAAKVLLADKYLTKIREDYATLIDIFIQYKDSMTSSYIESYIGSAIIY